MEKNKSLMHSIISENLNACNEDVIPEGFGEFGLDKTNPIPIYGIDNIHSYMSKLNYEAISKDGSSILLPVQYQRTIENDDSEVGSEMPITEGLVGSTYSNNIGNNIDVYNVYTFDGSNKLAKLFIHCYHWRTSSKAPKGFLIVNDNKQFTDNLQSSKEDNTLELIPVKVHEKLTVPQFEEKLSEKKEVKIEGDTGWIIFGFILCFMGGWGGLAFGINYLKSKYDSNTRIIGVIMILLSIIMRVVLSIK